MSSSGTPLNINAPDFVPGNRLPAPPIVAARPAPPAIASLDELLAHWADTACDDHTVPASLVKRVTEQINRQSDPLIEPIRDFVETPRLRGDWARLKTAHDALGAELPTTANEFEIKVLRAAWADRAADEGAEPVGAMKRAVGRLLQEKADQAVKSANLLREGAAICDKRKKAFFCDPFPTESATHGAQIQFGGRKRIPVEFRKASGAATVTVSEKSKVRDQAFAIDALTRDNRPVGTREDCFLVKPEAGGKGRRVYHAVVQQYRGGIHNREGFDKLAGGVTKAAIVLKYSFAPGSTDVQKVRISQDWIQPVTCIDLTDSRGPGIAPVVDSTGNSIDRGAEWATVRDTLCRLVADSPDPLGSAPSTSGASTSGASTSGASTSGASVSSSSSLPKRLSAAVAAFSRLSYLVPAYGQLGAWVNGGTPTIPKERFSQLVWNQLDHPTYGEYDWVTYDYTNGGRWSLNQSIIDLLTAGGKDHAGPCSCARVNCFCSDRTRFKKYETQKPMLEFLGFVPTNTRKDYDDLNLFASKVEEVARSVAPPLPAAGP